MSYLPGMKNNPIPDKPYTCPDADITILPMSHNDIDEILEIENQSFPKPWSIALFEKELDNPFSFSFVARLNKKDSSKPSTTFVRVGGTARVGHSDVVLGKLIGYIVIWLVAEESHVLNIAVHPDYRRKGIGKRLIKFIMDFLLNKSTRAVYLEVRKSNTAAQKLYRGLGFREIGVRKGYYSDNKEDAVVMGLELKDRLKAEGERLKAKG